MIRIRDIAPHPVTPLRPFGQRQPRRFVCRLGRSRPCKSPGVPWTPEKKNAFNGSIP